jgi:hypothetical protein
LLAVVGLETEPVQPQTVAAVGVRVDYLLDFLGLVRELNFG